MSKYYPPTFDGGAFHCPICRVYASQTWQFVRRYTANQVFDTPYRASYCHHCDKVSYWQNKQLVLPATATVEPHHADLSEECISDYDEARDIFGRSPKGAAALLRLCVQKLMVSLGQTGKNINDDIASLVSKGLPVEVQQALDYCRVVGNNAVHPGEIQLDDTPELAGQLFSMINFIVEDRIARPRQIAALFAQLPTGALEAIEKRDK